MQREPLFHDRPDRSGHPFYDVELVSAEVPSGAAWLANCLLELGISVWKPWGADDSAHWLQLGDRRYRYVGGDNGWSRVLPALMNGREFDFRESPCVRVHHSWPDVYPRAQRRILFVRDPRDALHSAWHRARRRRTIAESQDLVEFCGSRFFHFPLSWQDYLLLFLRVSCLAADRDGTKILRFEDYRQDPVATLRDALTYLQVEVTSQAIRDATDASSVARVKREDLRLAALGVVDHPIVRGEPPGEHVRQFDERARRHVGDRFSDVCIRLGYEHATTSPPSRALPVAGTLTAIVSALRVCGLSIKESDWLWTALRDSLHGIEPLSTSLA